jgi:hypothetical protein
MSAITKKDEDTGTWMTYREHAKPQSRPYFETPQKTIEDYSPLDKSLLLKMDTAQSKALENSILREALKVCILALEEINTRHASACFLAGRNPEHSGTLRIVREATSTAYEKTRGIR